MTWLGSKRFISDFVETPPEAFSITEATIGRSLTLEERRVLGEVFEATIGAYDMLACEPNAVQVRKWLRWIAKNERVPVGTVDAIGHARLRLAVALGKHADDRDGNHEHIFATPMAGEVELSRAIELVDKTLKSRGLQIRDASQNEIKDAATEAVRVISVHIGRGRPRSTYDLGLLWAWADLAERLGMTASASYKPTKKSRDSPFLRWLTSLASHMPDRTRKVFTRGLAERAKLALRLRRENDIDSGLFDD